MAITQMVGASIRRREDPRLVTGTSSYVEDLSRTAVLHMHVVRSSEAHARIASIDTKRAKDADGVVAVFTGKDLQAEFNAPLPVTNSFIPEKKYPNHYPIAVDKVRYVGEPVAVVVATSRAAAEDAGERIDIRYESLPPVLDMEKAIENDAPVLHDDVGSNLSYDVKRSGGDIDAAFKEAEVRIQQRLIQQRLIPIAIEPRGVLAEYKRFENKMTLWSSTQIPHFVKVWVAVILGIPESNVRVVAPETGVDPVEVRRKNFVPADEQPFTNCLGLTYDSGDYRITLDKALQMLDYKGFRRDQEEKRKQGMYLGIGF